MYDIVIPVYNEGENIHAVLESLAQHVKKPVRILIAYDHESDNTLPVARAFPASRLQVLCIQNKYSGVLGAIKTGFEYSDSPAVMMFPADDTLNAGILDRMFEEYENGSEIVAASRFMKGGCMIGCPIVKAVIVRAAAFILYHIGRLPTHDPSNGFRLFSRRVLQAFPIESAEGFPYSIELLVKAHRRGLKITEVPSRWMERTSGKSRFKLMKWLPQYFVWFKYAFATTYCHKTV